MRVVVGRLSMFPLLGSRRVSNLILCIHRNMLMLALLLVLAFVHIVDRLLEWFP